MACFIDSVPGCHWAVLSLLNNIPNFRFKRRIVRRRHFLTTTPPTLSRGTSQQQILSLDQKMILKTSIGCLTIYIQLLGNHIFLTIICESVHSKPRAVVVTSLLENYHISGCVYIYLRLAQCSCSRFVLTTTLCVVCSLATGGIREMEDADPRYFNPVMWKLFGAGKTTAEDETADLDNSKSFKDL